MSGFSSQNDGTIHRWDESDLAASGDTFGHSQRVYDLHYNGEYLFSASQDETVKLWDPDTLTEEGEFTGHTDRVYSVTTDGSNAFSSGMDDTVRKWDIETQTESASFDEHSGGNVNHILIYNDVGYSGGNGGVIRTWDPSDMGSLGDTFDDHGTNIRDFEIYEAESVGISVGNDAMVRKWDLDTLTQQDSTDQPDQIEIIAIDQSNDWVFVGGDYNGLSRLDATTLNSIDTIDPIGNRTEAVWLDGQDLFTGDNEGNIEKWVRD